MLTGYDVEFAASDQSKGIGIFENGPGFVYITSIEQLLLEAGSEGRFLHCYLPRVKAQATQAK